MPAFPFRPILQFSSSTAAPLCQCIIRAIAATLTSRAESSELQLYTFSLLFIITPKSRRPGSAPDEHSRNQHRAIHTVHRTGRVGHLCVLETHLPGRSVHLLPHSCNQAFPSSFGSSTRTSEPSPHSQSAFLIPQLGKHHPNQPSPPSLGTQLSIIITPLIALSRRRDASGNESLSYNSLVSHRLSRLLSLAPSPQSPTSSSVAPIHNKNANKQPNNKHQQKAQPTSTARRRRGGCSKCRLANSNNRPSEDHFPSQ